MKRLRVFDKSVLLLVLAGLLAMGLWLVTGLCPAGGVRVHTERKADPMENAQAWRAGTETDGLMAGEIMNLNTATYSDLTRLPGIGAGRAEDIVAWREQNGGFDSVEELTEIKGIGKVTLEGLRPYVRVEK